MLFLHALIFLLFGTSVGAVPVPWGILPKSVNTCLHDCISTWRVIWTVVTGPKQRTDDYYWSTIDHASGQTYLIYNSYAEVKIIRPEGGMIHDEAIFNAERIWKRVLDLEAYQKIMGAGANPEHPWKHVEEDHKNDLLKITFQVKNDWRDSRLHVECNEGGHGTWILVNVAMPDATKGELVSSKPPSRYGNMQRVQKVPTSHV